MTAAATPTPGNDQVVVSKQEVSMPDEAFDLKFAQERHEKFELQPGAKVGISSISGRIEVAKSDSANAEVHIVRSVQDREDMKTRELTIKKEGNEIDIHMGSKRRSALFSMFNDTGREKQRILLKLPANVDLHIDSTNGRIVITELDGRLSIAGVSGRVMIGKITGDTALADIRGPVRFVGEGSSKHGVSASGIFGNLELLFNGTVNAQVQVEEVFGAVDQGLPNLVYEAERRPGDNSFRGRAGKGGAVIKVVEVHGRVRIAPATPEDNSSIALAKPGVTPEAGKPSAGPGK